jgi:hypothetical protein
MYGKTHSDEFKESQANVASARFKGKSYVQLYGDEKASLLKKGRSESIKSFCVSNPEARVGSNNPNAKSYEFTSPTGEKFITTGNLKKFCKEQGLQCDRIINVLKGREETHKGWRARYI